MTPLDVVEIVLWVSILVIISLREMRQRKRRGEQTTKRQKIAIRVKNDSVKVEIDKKDFAHINSIIRRHVGVSLEEILTRAVMNELNKMENFVAFAEKEETEG